MSSFHVCPQFPTLSSEKNQLTRLIFKKFQTSKACNTWQCNSVYTLNFWFALISWPELYIWCTIRKYWDILSNPVLVYSPNTLHYTHEPADVHEGILLLSKILKFEHHSIASGGYHSVRSLTVLVIVITCCWIISPFKFWTATIFLHAHLQVVYYNYVKFNKTPISCLGGVALTRYTTPLFVKV
jgi:hypothetical protein